MSRRHLWIVGVLAFALSAWAQDSTSPSEVPQGTPQEPVPAYGQEHAPPPILENPPITGLDLPGLEPHGAPVSYIQPGATINESADSNIGNAPGVSAVNSISRGLGSIALQRLWSHYDLALDYVGGVGYYNLKGLGWKSLQQADVDQKVTWKRGQLSLRDSFSYLPEGNFGGAYGSQGSQGIQSLGTTAFGSFWGGSTLGSLGLAPRILNLGLADVSENLTPKSAITAAGGYAFTHFYGNEFTGAPFLGSSQISAQAGYDRILTAHTQVALMYGYQGFDFSVLGSAFHSHIIQAVYGHRVSGRMDFQIGAGPQFTVISLPGIACSDPTDTVKQCFDDSGESLVPATTKNNRLGVSGRARLRYKFPKTSVDLAYERFETSGSGLFAGAQTDLATLSAERPLTRVWSVSMDLGFSHNGRLQPLSTAQLATCVFAGQPNPKNLPICPGVDASTFNTGFAGLALHRAFGHNFHGFVSYQINELSFDHSYCAGVTVCSRISNRHVGTIGLDWTPRPLRID